MADSDNLGRFIVITGPSASGKTEVTRTLIEKIPGSSRHITTTTRLPRPGEEHSKDYFFISREDFEKGIANGDFFEYAEVYGELYGSSRSALEGKLRSHRYVFGIIDVQGAQTLKKIISDAFVIFIKPGRTEDLRKRLLERKSSSHHEMDKRIETAEYELSLAPAFDAVVLNIDGQFDETIAKIQAILGAN